MLEEVPGTAEPPPSLCFSHACPVTLAQGEDMGIPSDTDEDNQEEEISSESGFGNVLGELVG